VAFCIAVAAQHREQAAMVLVTGIGGAVVLVGIYLRWADSWAGAVAAVLTVLVFAASARAAHGAAVDAEDRAADCARPVADVAPASPAEQREPASARGVHRMA
jgi:hypothetical protein